MGIEKRRQPRVELSNPLKVIDTMSSESLGLVVNLSADGMMLIGEKALVDGAVYQAEMPLNPDEDATLKVGIECLWVSEADSENKNWSGFKIIDISEEDKTFLADLVASI